MAQLSPNFSLFLLFFPVISNAISLSTSPSSFPLVCCLYLSQFPCLHFPIFSFSLTLCMFQQFSSPLSVITPLPVAGDSSSYCLLSESMVSKYLISPSFYWLQFCSSWSLSISIFSCITQPMLVVTRQISPCFLSFRLLLLPKIWTVWFQILTQSTTLATMNGQTTFYNLANIPSRKI